MIRVIASAISAVNAEGLDIWLLQVPELLVGFLIITVTAGLAVLGLVVSRRFLPPEWLKPATGKDQVFALAGRLYTVLLAFTVVLVWQQFEQAQKTTWSEAVAIGILIRDSEGLPAAARPAVQQSLIAYTNDVVNNEFPRMRHGELIEQQSDSLTRVWQSYLHVQPETVTENTFYKESITQLSDLVSARKTRIASSEAEIPGEMWVLLLGGGMIVLALCYLFATPDLKVYGIWVGLAAALLSFVLYLVLQMQHAFIGDVSVGPEAYTRVLDTWSHLVPR
jgi:hypothetical protein